MVAKRKQASSRAARSSLADAPSLLDRQPAVFHFLAAGPPVALNDVLRPEEAMPRVDAAMEAALAEHLPQSDTIPETAAGTLSTPQMAQVTHDKATHLPPLPAALLRMPCLMRPCVRGAAR